MKHSLIFSLLFLSLTMLSKALHAQSSFELPKDIELKSKDDYSKYEKTMVEAATWLEKTDLDKEAEKRKEVNSFVVKWISGSPTVTVDIDKPLMNIIGKDEQLLALYLAAYAKDVIENKSSSKLSAIKSGITATVNVYKKKIEVSRNKELEKLSKLDDHELNDYIVDRFRLPKMG